MTITKRVELDMIGFDVGNDPVTQGRMSLRWRKLTYNGDELLSTDYHRAIIDVDTDLDAYLETVAQELERQGFGRPPETDRGYIDDMCNRAWTPEVREAVAADRIERANKAKAEEKKRNEREEAAIKTRADEMRKMLTELGVDVSKLQNL